MSNIAKRGRILVKAGHPRVVQPHKGPASQKPKKLKCAYRLRPGQVEQLEKQREGLKLNTTDAFKKVTMEAMEAVEARAKALKRKSVDSMVAAANADLPSARPRSRPPLSVTRSAAGPRACRQRSADLSPQSPRWSPTPRDPGRGWAK